MGVPMQTLQDFAICKTNREIGQTPQIPRYLAKRLRNPPFCQPFQDFAGEQEKRSGSGAADTQQEDQGDQPGGERSLRTRQTPLLKPPAQPGKEHGSATTRRPGEGAAPASRRQPATDNISSATYTHFIMPIVFGIICLLGIIGNGIVFCTVCKKSKLQCGTSSSSVPDIFIINLSVVDMLFLLGMPFLIHQLLGNGVWHFGETMCTIITAVDTNSQFTSTYILTAMAIDRYLATVYPFTSAKYRKTLFAVGVICVLWLLSLLSITPVWMYARLIPLPGAVLGCGLRLPNPEMDIYWYTLYQFFLAFAIPFTMISVAYRRILLKMSTMEAVVAHRSVRLRTKKVTRLAITICLVFFICWAPFYLLQLIQLAMDQPTLSFYYAYCVAISLGYANSCLNPFIYIILCASFRRRFIVTVKPAEDIPQSLVPNRLHNGPPLGRRQALLRLTPVSVEN
ncbi:melanin-concentrating hormone receptor 1-like [Lissotriton helveticus]